MARKLIINTKCQYCNGEVEKVTNKNLKEKPHYYDVEYVVTRRGVKQYFHRSCWEEQKKGE